MRTWTFPFIALLAAGCAAPSEPVASVPLTWTGAFGGGQSTPGHLTVLFDEGAPTWNGTMYFEAEEADGSLPRVTYRIEGEGDEGSIRVHQKEILQGDPLSGGRQWCLGTYDFSFAPDVGSGAGSSALSGEYTEPTGRCGGTTALQPTDTL